MTRNILFGLAVMCMVGAGANADVTLRVVTFNTYQGIDDTSSARTASGNLLTSLDLDGPGPNTSLTPDIVCLQETRYLSDLEDFRDEYLPGYQVIKGPTTDGFFSNGFFIRGDLTILKFNEFGTPGPRPLLRIVLEVPEASEYLVVYTSHFKAGSDGSDITTRRAEANAVANRISVDRLIGIDVDGDGYEEYFPTCYLMTGDLNQDDFGSDVIDALLVGGSNGLPTHLNNARVETLYGAQFPTTLVNTFSTRYSLSRRYDYLLPSDTLFEVFDTNGDETVDQDELNAAGFSYISQDDNGLQASGDYDASEVASDHAAVVLNITLPSVLLGDLDGDGDVDLSDLAQLLAHYGMTSGATPEEGDLDGDGDVDLSDLAALLGNYGA